MDECCDEAIARRMSSASGVRPTPKSTAKSKGPPALRGSALESQQSADMQSAEVYPGEEEGNEVPQVSNEVPDYCEFQGDSDQVSDEDVLNHLWEVSHWFRGHGNLRKYEDIESVVAILPKGARDIKSLMDFDAKSIVDFVETENQSNLERREVSTLKELVSLAEKYRELIMQEPVQESAEPPAKKKKKERESESPSASRTGKFVKALSKSIKKKKKKSSESDSESSSPDIRRKVPKMLEKNKLVFIKGQDLVQSKILKKIIKDLKAGVIAKSDLNGFIPQYTAEGIGEPRKSQLLKERTSHADSKPISFIENAAVFWCTHLLGNKGDESMVSTQCFHDPLLSILY